MGIGVTSARFGELLGDRCLTDANALLPYETPERGPPGFTPCVLRPQSEFEVFEALAIANREKMPLVLSAGRSGLVEAQRPEGETVLSLEDLASPIAIELPDRRRLEFPSAIKPPDAARALSDWWQSIGRPVPNGAILEIQAGLSVDGLNEILAPLGLMWPMEMGSSSAASIGGCVANLSAGSNAVCYGTAAHMTESATGIWADGTRTDPCAGLTWSGVDPTRVSIDSAAVNIDHGLVGTQGVLGVITRLRVRTYPVPAQREAVLLPLAGMPAAMRLLSSVRREFGGDIEEFEFISSAAMALVREHLGASFRSPLGERDSRYFGLLQVKSQWADEDLAGRLYGVLTERIGVPEDDVGYAPLKALKLIRHSITEASNRRARLIGGGRLTFDTATPTAVFGDYLDALERGVRDLSPTTEVITFGHAGVGGAHIHLLGTGQAPIGTRADALVERVFDVTAEFRGTFSAEHGVGPKWAREFQQRVPAGVRAALRSAKQLHDPQGILNPRSFGLNAV